MTDAGAWNSAEHSWDENLVYALSDKLDQMRGRREDFTIDIRIPPDAVGMLVVDLIDERPFPFFGKDQEWREFYRDNGRGISIQVHRDERRARVVLDKEFFRVAEEPAADGGRSLRITEQGEKRRFAPRYLARSRGYYTTEGLTIAKELGLLVGARFRLNFEFASMEDVQRVFGQANDYLVTKNFLGHEVPVPYVPRRDDKPRPPQ